MLFNRAVLENIMYGVPLNQQPAREEVVHILMDIGAKDLAKSLDMPASKGGGRLSSGQR